MSKRSHSTAQLETTPVKTKSGRSNPPETPRKPNPIYCQHPPRDLNNFFNVEFECPCKDDEHKSKSMEYPRPAKISPKDLNLTIDYEYVNDDGTYALTTEDAQKFEGFDLDDVCMQEMDPKMLDSADSTFEGEDIIEHPIKIHSNQSDVIEDGLRKYDTNLRKEWHVIGESTFPLNRARTKFISVGLSPALEFTPIIKIRGGRNCIFFTPDQFKELVESKENVDTDNIVIGDHRIHKSVYKEKDVFNFECRNSNIVLALDTYKKLHSLGSLIAFKLKVFELIDFQSFYKEILQKCVDNKNVGDLNDKIHIVILAELTKDYRTSLLLETLNFAYNKICLDYELMRLYSKNN